MAGVAWVDLRSAFQDLKVKARRRPEFKSAINKLSLILVKIESSSLEPKFISEACTYFRQEVMPFYKAYLLEMAHLASVLFDCIQTQKAAKKNFSIVQSWELVQKSTLSGILDYLEEAQSSDTKVYETIAEHMFPVLCRYFFPSEWSANYEEISIELKTTVYILLSDTIKGHESLQRSLRDPKLLGGARFGLELARVRAYLHLEALFELFEKLVPEDSDECNLFVDSVFNPALFSQHQELKAIVASLKNQTWDEVFPMIVQIFARMSIRFPQPIPITDAMLSDSSPSPSETLYVDQRGLTYNIDVDDAIDTCHVAYHNILKIRYSRYSHASILTTTFNFELAVPPTVGKDVPEPRAVTLTVDVPRQKRDNFLNALKARGLASLFDQTERKISLADSNEPLDFPSQLEDPPQSFPEKSQQILREMTPSDKITSSSPKPFKKVSPPQETVTLINPTQILGKQPRSHRSITSFRKKPPSDRVLVPSSSLNLSRENSPAARGTANKYPGKPLKKGRETVQSVNELEQELPPKKIMKSSPLRSHIVQANVKKRVVVSLDTEVRKKVDYNASGKENGQQPPELLSKKSALKRKALQAEEISDRPSKRSRPELEPNTIPSPLLNKAHRRGRRYGRKERGRTSSPSLDEDFDDDDLESIPKSIMTTGKPSAGARKTEAVAATIKGRTGKKEVTMPKIKSKVNGKGTAPEEAVLQAKLKHDPVIVEDAKSIRRSARVAGKQQIDTKQYENVDGAPGRENCAKTNQENPNKVTQKSRPKPKAINKKGLLEGIEVSLQRGADVEKPSRPSRIENETQPPAGPKVEKDNKAPWEKTDYIKQREENMKSSPSKRPSLFKEPTSDIELPVEIPFDGFDHIDIEVPLKSISNESSELNEQLESGIHKRGDHNEPATIDLTMSSPIRKDHLKPSNFAIPSPSITRAAGSVFVEDIEQPNPMSGSNLRRIHNLAESASEKLDHLRQKTSSGFANDRSPAASGIAPIVPAPLQPKNGLKASKQESSTLFKNANTESAPLLPSLNHPKVLPPVTLLRQNALDIPEDTQVSTPPRLAPEKTFFEPPSFNQRIHHQQHVAFSHLPQLSPRTGLLTVGRWETGQREHVRKLRDAHKSGQNSVIVSRPENHLGALEDEKNAEIRDIVEILNEIQEVLIIKISNRFNGVKKDVRIGRDNILRAAAADIDKMRAESAEHYNAFVDLEAEYASFRRYLIRNLEDLFCIDKDVVDRVTEIIQHHDRHGLTKKFPKSLPAVPACFLSKQ